MMTLEELRRQKQEILRLADRRGARRLRIFGSVARGSAGGESDVDMVVQMDSDRSLLDRIGLMHDLQDLLHTPVDIANEAALPAAIRHQVEREGVEL